MSGRLTDQEVRRRLAGLHASPDLLPQNLDLIMRRVLLLEFGEQRYQESSFLDDRMIDDKTTGFWTGLDTLPEPGQPRAARWLFHIGHCGSTLISRLLPALAPMLPVREPPPLRTLAESLRHLGDPLSRLDRAQWQRLCHMFSALYSRAYDPRTPALIKPSSDCVNLIHPALDQHADSRALLVYQSLETYLATMLIGPVARPDIEGHAVTRLKDLHEFLDDRESLRLYELTPVQRVVVSWLSGVGGMHRASRDCGDRVRLLDFDRFMASPMEELSSAAVHLGIRPGEERLRGVLDGPVMQTYAKAPEYRFSPADRAQQLAEKRRQSAAEIAQGLRWAEAMAKRYAQLGPVIDVFPMGGTA